MTRRGLLPGEVYGFVTPDPGLQPQGLSRILTKTTWRLDDSAHAVNWKRPSPEVFTPSDRIEIAVRFRGPMTLKLRPANGLAPIDEAIRDYPSPPQVVIANVSFPDFLIETTGADYSREDSAGYTIAERRACLRVKLRERPVAAWLAGARGGPLLKTAWDLADPADFAEWEVMHPLLAVLETRDGPTTPSESMLWDKYTNAHVGNEAGAFARILVRDIPASPLSSVAGLQALDLALWDGEDSFLPHGLQGGAQDSDQPILIGTGAIGNAAQALMLVDGAETTPEEAKDLERVWVLFDGYDEAALNAARGLWTRLTAAGLAAQYWSEETGRWEKKTEKPARTI